MTETAEQLSSSRRQLYGSMCATDIREDYTFLKIVGSGAFATVFQASRGGKMYAVKTIRKKEFRFGVDPLKQELEVYKLVDSPYIVKFEGVY